MNNDLRIADPWEELISRIDSPDLEAEALQSLDWSNLKGYLAALRRIWTLGASSRGEQALLQSLASSIVACSYAQEHPVGRVLSFLVAQLCKAPSPPLIPIAPLLPLYQLAELSLLWYLAGEKEAAQTLGEKIVPLAPFLSFWCPEEEFFETDANWSLVLLQRLFGIAASPPTSLPPPYFLALARALQGASLKLPPSSPFFTDPQYGLAAYRSSEVDFALSLAGERTPLGAFFVKAGVEVRAFGPQRSPLSDPKGFGILRLPDSLPMERWTALASLPDVWMEVFSAFEKNSAHLQLKFLGLKPEHPMTFAFYIKAMQSEIEGEGTFQPRSLKRYRGEAKRVQFDKKVQIQSCLPTAMELIPLAGEKAFWGSSYLLAFDIHPFEAKGEYEISIY